MSLHSWGNYPKINNTVLPCKQQDDLSNIIKNSKSLIPCGNGRSYGDSALNKTIVDIKPLNDFLNFDDNSGLLHIQAGVLLSEILEIYIPQGWFLKITPGTKFITVGGAIASDVHGKNHHIEGCFSQSIKDFRLMLADGSVITCSQDENKELFNATCGGMGLTGVILDARIFLKKINSKYIDQTTIKTGDLRETFDAFEQYSQYSYSVAWIDCLAKGNNTGRCLLSVGEFRNDNILDYKPTIRTGFPFFLPSFFLNTLTVKIFNFLYYGRVRKKITKQKVDIDQFFYPLDAIKNWNKIYGKKGFIQYQFVLPKKDSYDGMSEILNAIAKSGKGSFLAVLKLHGKNNDNFLSFPLEGYSLALDFKIEPDLFNLLDKLDNIVLKYKGRIYLAKDARVSMSTFEQGYPDIAKFREIRKKYALDKKFTSLQSNRIGI